MGTTQFRVFKPRFMAYPPPFEYRGPFITGKEFEDKNVYQIIRLKKATSEKERRASVIRASSFPDKAKKDVPDIIRLIDQENKYLGYK